MPKKNKKKSSRKPAKRNVVRAKPKKSVIISKASKLSPRAFGLAFGILWGLTVLMMGLAGTYWGYGAGFTNLFATLYPGFTLGVQGSIIGSLWGLVDGFIFGVLLAWLYNRFV